MQKVTICIFFASQPGFHNNGSHVKPCVCFRVSMALVWYLRWPIQSSVH